MFLSKKSTIILIPLCGLLLFSACKKDAGTSESSAEKASAESSPNGEFKSEIEKVSYILGFSMGKGYNEQAVDVNPDIFIRGMKEGLTKGAKPAFTEVQMRETMQAFRTNLMEKRRKEREEAVGKNLAEGEKFLSDNKAKSDVVTLPSGLQYKVLTAGTGEKPTEEDTAIVQYTGSLINGEEFDSSKTHGDSVPFPVKGVIPGMKEALQLMPVGSKWELYVPASLAYGVQGYGAKIGPNQTLKFELELMSIKKPEKAAEKTAPESEPAKPAKPAAPEAKAPTSKPKA